MEKKESDGSRCFCGLENESEESRTETPKTTTTR